MISVMPSKRKKQLPPIKICPEPFGQRLARFRRQKGLTQSELADKVGINQPLLSDYERGRLQMSAEMAARFALALKVSCDELLGIKNGKHNNFQPHRRIMKRLEKIQKLTPNDQRTLLRTIDGFLRGSA